MEDQHGEADHGGNDTGPASGGVRAGTQDSIRNNKGDGRKQGTELTLTQRLAALFRGHARRQGTHGKPTYDASKNKWPVSATAVTLKPGDASWVPPAVWEKHVAGKRPHGVVTIREDLTGCWASIDVDTYDLDIEDVLEKMVAAKLPAALIPARSKSGGLHLFVFFREPQSAAAVQAALVKTADVLRAVVPGLAAASIEIFPKQKELSDNGGGSWMIAPYFGSTYGNKMFAQCGLKARGAEMDLGEFLRAAEAARTTVEEFTAALPEVKKSKAKRRKPTGGGAPTAADDGASYAAGMLEKYAAELAPMQHGDRDPTHPDDPKKNGGRNASLSWRAYHLGQMVGREWIREEAITAALEAVIEGWTGSNKPHHRETLRNQLKVGQQNPHKDLEAAGRTSLRAPPERGEFLPVMRKLNDVLGSVTAPVPPARNIDGALVRVRQQPMLRMHAFLTANEDADTTQGAPPQYAIRVLSNEEVAEEIEQHVHFYEVNKEGERVTVHLASPFVRHYRRRDDVALPIVSAISVLPLVTADGRALQADGLDRRTGIVFLVPPGIAELMPQRKACKPGAIAEAMKFLKDDWLHDVATDFAGKCVLIAAALTLIERSLLEERPAFFVTAGMRGNGKTTAIRMLIAAVFGVEAAAAAWSPKDEERRKALMSYLMSGVAYVLWDNIPRGAAISCPHIEKACTAAVFTDRVLGVSETATVSAAAVHLFTGNNVSPVGDLASRSLMIRLSTESTDPENRAFTHPDIIAWTLEHRGEILQALFTVLLGNPTLSRPRDAAMNTRFKMWYRLIGSAVEHAAECAGGKLDFRELFLTTEDEELVGMADSLETLGRLMDWKPFRAADLFTRLAATAETDNDARVVRGWLFPNEYEEVTSVSVGYALKARVDVRVTSDRGTLVLKTAERSGTTKVSNRYYVHTERKPGACETPVDEV